MTEREYLTDTEVADLFGVSRYTIARLAKAGKIPAVRLGSQWRFKREEILAFRFDAKGAA
jgi:excisionase family DNA binding protein